jgi:hypothetical protein
VARKFDLYRQIWQECNHPGPMPRVFLQRQVHVAETDAKAHEEQPFQYLPVFCKLLPPIESDAACLEVTAMLLDTVFAPFLKERPIGVMARAV